MENGVKLFESQTLSVMQELSALKKEQDRLADLEKQAKDKLQKAMEEYGVISFKNEYVTISNVAESTTTTIDLKAMEEKEPKLYKELLADYAKTTTKKSYIRIQVK